MTKFDHILGHKKNISNLCFVEILQITCDYDTIKLEITNENKQVNKQNKLVLPPGNKKFFLLNNSWLQGNTDGNYRIYNKKDNENSTY